jgi:hypothetical protein
MSTLWIRQVKRHYTLQVTLIIIIIIARVRYLVYVGHSLAGIGNVEIISILIDNNANVNSLNVKRQGITPLHVAASSGYGLHSD